MDDEDWDDSDVDTIECFECGKSFYEDAPQCPDCGYIPLSSDRRQPAWMFWVVILMLAAMILPFVVWLIGALN